MDLLVLLEELEFFAKGGHASRQVGEDVSFFNAVVHGQMRAEGQACRQELAQCRSWRPSRGAAGVVEQCPLLPEMVMLNGIWSIEKEWENREEKHLQMCP